MADVRILSWIAFLLMVPLAISMIIRNEEQAYAIGLGFLMGMVLTFAAHYKPKLQQ